MYYSITISVSEHSVTHSDFKPMLTTYQGSVGATVRISHAAIIERSVLTGVVMIGRVKTMKMTRLTMMFTMIKVGMMLRNQS